MPLIARTCREHERHQKRDETRFHSRAFVFCAFVDEDVTHRKRGAAVLTANISTASGIQHGFDIAEQRIQMK